jgi:hypothetical protein
MSVGILKPAHHWPVLPYLETGCHTSLAEGDHGIHNGFLGMDIHPKMLWMEIHPLPDLLHPDQTDDRRLKPFHGRIGVRSNRCLAVHGGIFVSPT